MHFQDLFNSSDLHCTLATHSQCQELNLSFIQMLISRNPEITGSPAAAGFSEPLTPAPSPPRPEEPHFALCIRPYLA